MRTELIRDKAAELKDRYGTCDPYELCDALKIQLLLRHLGIHEKSCKGFFLTNARCSVIVLNSDLSEQARRIITAHELGHAVLHGSAGMANFHDVSFFDFTDRMEYEAGVFSAELLLDDEEVLEVLNTGADFYESAKRLSVPYELLDFKLRGLVKAGYDIEAPHMARGDFLKRNLGLNDA